MHPQKIIPPLLVIALIAGGGYYYYQQEVVNGGGFTVSGTVEATEIQLASIQGGRVDSVDVREGDPVEEDAVVAIVHPGTRGTSGREMIHAPIAGVVLDRSIEPGEVVAAGTPLITLIDPTDLTVTVYVPEDRYGLLKLGQTYPVTVDSFPGEVFTGTVMHIADEAEFTPRNVQTTDSRKNTVFAIKLDLPPSEGKLKPGMPADVRFQVAQ
jgi:multidrug resistance efflux pump